MTEGTLSGPTFFVRAAATWTADNGAPRSEPLGKTRVATTRLGRMAGHVVAALPTLPELRRTRPTWIVASATGPLDAIVAAVRTTTTTAILRPEALAADGPSSELAARLGGLRPFVQVGAGTATVAMALIEAAAWLATGAEDVVLIVSEAELPRGLSPEVRYEPLAVALHLAADPGHSDLAVLAGPDVMQGQLESPTGPHAGSPGEPALALARAALRSETAVVALDTAQPQLTGSLAASTAWFAQIKPVEHALA